MEKAHLLETAGSLPAQHPSRSSRRALCTTLLLCILALVHLFHRTTITTPKTSGDELGMLYPTECWKDNIKPPYECYYLMAPLDHLNASDERTARLAAVTYPAGGGKTAAKDILGTILLNPGGPGGSGVGFVTASRPRFNNRTTGDAIDRMMKGRYNILSWDPRAIGHSTPLANCYKWESQRPSCSGDLPHASSSAVACDLQTHRLDSALCAEHTTLSDELRFVSTPSTARDMKLLYRAMGDDKLHYWGFSYGTVLGSVFADMFPDDVGRVVLDGTVDVPNYMYGNWSDNLLDTQNTYEKGLIGKCIEAGDKCALNKAAKGSKDLKTALDDLLARLLAEPMLSLETNTTMLEYSTFKATVFDALYAPYKWPTTTEAMAKVLEGDAAPFIKTYVESGGEREPSPHAMVAIAGGDALMRREHTWGKADYEALIAELEEQSIFAGEVWASDQASVQAWSIIGKERHYGDFTSSTAYPLLYVGNDYDPVTPLTFARKMATLFPKAAVLRVKSFGHCSISQPSKCAKRAIADYFVNGTVPTRITGSDGYVEAGIVCDVDKDPWDVVVKAEGNDDSEEDTLIIHDALHQAWKRPSRF